MKGQTLTILGGTEQQYVNSLMANLQRGQLTLPGTATHGLPAGAERVADAAPIAPVMPRATATTLVGTVPTETRTGGTQTVEPVIEIPPPGRRGNYAAGFLNILPKIVPTAQLLQQAGEIGAARGATKAVQNLRFRQTAGTAATYTVPELQQRFAEGHIVRVPGGRPTLAAVQAAAQAAAGGGGGGGGGPAAVQAVAEEVAEEAGFK
jgi:hypothetical protein